MSDTSFMPVRSLHQPPIVFVLFDARVAPDQLPNLADVLRDQFSEGNHPLQIEFVGYCVGSVPFFYVGGEHKGTSTIPPLVTVSGNSLNEAVFRGYISGIKMIKKRKRLEQDPDGFSYHLCHIAVGQRDDVGEYPDFGGSRDSWHTNWNLVRDELTNFNIKLSVILINSSFDISCTRAAPGPPQLYASPYDMILLLGFIPTRTQSMENDLPLGVPALQYPEGDLNMQVIATNAGQTQPHGHGAPGLDATIYNDNGIEQPIPHDRMEDLIASGDPENAGPTAGEMSSNNVEWNGTLHLNGVYVRARARANESVRNLKLSAWRKNLQLEPGQVDEPVTALDVQAWILENKAPVVRLSGIEGNFYQLAEEVKKGGGYAIGTWMGCDKTLDPLLLAPAGSVLLCAAFPDGIKDLPTHQLPRKIRTNKRKKGSNSQPEQPQGASITQDAEESMQGDPDPSSSSDQEDELAQYQDSEMSSHEMDVDEESDDGQTDAGCESDSSDN